MKLIVNGQMLESEAATLAALLSELGYADTTVATALNSDFVAKEARANTCVKNGDRIEILAPMKGG